VVESYLAIARTQLIQSRQDLVLQYRKKAEAKKKRLINFSETKRVVRFMFVSAEFNPRSEFNLRLESALTGTEYTPPEADRLLLEDLKSEKSDDEEVQKEPEVKKTLAKTVIADNFTQLSFAVASNPFEDTTRDQRQFSVVAELYTETGELVEVVSPAGQPKVSGVKVDPNCRNKKLKMSDDELIVLDLKRLPLDVAHVMLFVRTVKTGHELKYARYRLADYPTSQDVDVSHISKSAFNEDRPCLYLAYRLYRSEPNPRGLEITGSEGDFKVKMPEHSSSWLLDIYNIPVNKEAAELSELLQGTLRTGYEYLTALTADLAAYRLKKAVELVTYMKAKDEFEAKKRKKKSKKKSKDKMPVEPAQAPVYVTEPAEMPSFTVGPVSLDLAADTVETAESKVAEFFNTAFLSYFEAGWMLKVGRKPMKELRQLERLRPMTSLQIVARPKPVEEMVESSSIVDEG
jgi:hypothetical protein